MTLPVVFLVLAATLFVLSTVPKIQRPWMIGIGLALWACSAMPFFDLRLG